MLDVAAYFERIQYNAHPRTSLDCLQALHLAHCRNMPFENIDILTGDKIDISRDGLFLKLVTSCRGGYCYELNTLFSALLRKIGFQTCVLMSRVYRGLNSQFSKPRPLSHPLLLVRCDSRDYVVDVGFGGRDVSLPEMRSLLRDAFGLCLTEGVVNKIYRKVAAG